MRILSQVSAEPFSTFRFKQNLAQVTELNSVAELAAYQPEQTPIVLGEGSNTIFLQDITTPICRYTAASKSILAIDDNYGLLHVESGHNWHDLVTWAVDNNWWGIENLALIPGSVGAAPVQNIGAYGVEFADRCLYVDFYHWQSQTVQRITAARCQFSYRDSIFKQHLAGKGIIIAVGLLLQKKALPILNYNGLDSLDSKASIQDVYNTVIRVRNSKLPSPDQLANCGSFFKNPIITQQQYAVLKQQFPKLPGYINNDTSIKVPAAWLLEQQGFKGFQHGGVGCYDKQPLVLVNYGNGTADELVELIQRIIQAVQCAYAIILQPEVRLLTATGMLHGE
ncbi:UDP-N-acetylmuramate dehydrogenase [Rheinheimera salexigens]|uniref:UDP-N-acetylenolpyruvoylglucosamine reductase n=1 Tax=Rheinheimera salexigens TaxID=1628148 RepID=A0A1E7Q1W3_9GAMM|nr:UDP-N-acetylmuramate dehydrogenase [Rheinheimera salexigens]OEY68167.1 UDP-N-acetylenolpyruvoylglucosamine reductase [Rheinheimera salexigens]